MPLSPVKEDPDVQGDKGQFHIVLSLKGARSSLSSEDPVTEKPDAKRPRLLISSELRGGPHQNPNPVLVPVHQAKPSEDPDVCGDPVHQATPSEDPDVAKRPRFFISSDHFGVPGGPHQNPDPVPVHHAKPSEDPVTEKPDAKRRRWFISSELLDAPHQNPDPVHQAKPSEDPDVCGDPVQQATTSDGVQPSEPLTLQEIMKKHPRRQSKEEQLEYAEHYAKWKAPWVTDFHNRVLAVIAEFGGTKLKDQTFTPETLAAAEASMKKHRDTPFRNHVDFLKRRRVENPNENDAWNKYVESQKSTWTCKICLKTGDHMSLECPYLDYVPEGASVGPGVEIYCKGCTFKGKHDNTNCVKRAYRMDCCICGAGHWATDCPRTEQHKTNP